MGFAGQVFAARVAIGLAVPSPQAMQQSAGIIFQGVEAMYNRLAMLKKRNAMESEGALSEQFQGLSKLTVSSAKLMNDTLAQGVVDSIKKMDSATGQSLSSSLSRMGKQTKAFHSTQQALGKDSKLGKVFDTEGVQGDANKLAQITKQYMSLLREERDLVIQTTQDQLNGSRLLLQSYEAEITSMNSLKELNEEEQIRYDELNDKLIPALKEKVKFEELDVKILKQIEDNTKRVTREINAETEASRQLNQALRSSVHEIKEGFNNALRNSVALLTAFGYKLNQHAQDLISFERELLNANSVFGQTNSDLFDIGNDILEFGNKYGLAVENGAQGLYQLASAGLTANEAAALLPHTLKLSMAVQGDHNTLAKLTTQVIKGYGMEFSEAARLTDMFAFAIQKSLIEWQDLASAVKFAMPFFTSTGQSIEQLLGALQILTDRALEAGIAGRGLRQALAEFAESALDATVGFRKMGVEILSSEGEMLQLTEIAAQFAEAVGEDISNTQLLTTLIEDLNVRGATAFIHLVQASDEFTEAVENTAAASGELDKMVEIQNASLEAQIQIFKTSIFSIFAFRDATYEGTEFINGFHEALVNAVKTLQGMFVVIEDGVVKGLTPLGQELQDVGTNGVAMFADLLSEMIEIFREFAEAGMFSANMLNLMVMPLKVMLEVLNLIGPDMLKIILYMRILNSVLPLTALRWLAIGNAATTAAAAQAAAGTFAARLGATGLAGLGFRAATMATGVGGLLLAGYAVKKGMEYYSGRAAGGYVQPMAAGGMISGNHPYLVGEQGPELFMPNSTGKVLNSMQTQSIMGSDRTVLKNVTIGIDSFGGMV